jgi:hypothetical protein
MYIVVGYRFNTSIYWIFTSGITINDNTLSITYASGLTIIARYIFTSRLLILLLLRTSRGYLLPR